MDGTVDVDGIDFLAEVLAMVERIQAHAACVKEHDPAAAAELIALSRSLIAWSLDFARFRLRLLRTCTAYEFWEFARIIPPRLWAAIHRLRASPDVRYCVSFSLRHDTAMPEIQAELIRLLDWALLYSTQFAAIARDLRRGQHYATAKASLARIEQELHGYLPD